MLHGGERMPAMMVKGLRGEAAIREGAYNAAPQDMNDCFLGSCQGISSRVNKQYLGYFGERFPPISI